MLTKYVPCLICSNSGSQEARLLLYLEVRRNVERRISLPVLSIQTCQIIRGIKVLLFSWIFLCSSHSLLLTQAHTQQNGKALSIM